MSCLSFLLDSLVKVKIDCQMVLRWMEKKTLTTKRVVVLIFISNTYHNPSIENLGESVIWRSVEDEGERLFES